MRGRLVASSLTCSLLAACSSPSVRSPSAPAATAASLAVSSVAATVEKASVSAVYKFTFQLKETSGQSGATISSILFTMPSGAATFTATYTPATAQRVPPGGSLDLGPIQITDQAGPSTSLAAEASLTVKFVDDGGREGSAAGTGPVTRPLAYTVSGLITDGTSGPSGRMRDVLVEVIHGTNAGLQTRTDAGGNYAIAGIAPGTLTLSASTTDYETSTKEVNISGDTQVDFILPRIHAPVPTPLPGPTPSSGIGGTWTGTGVDSMGTINLTWGLSQAGSTLSGTVAMQAVDSTGSCNSCHRTKTGTFSGTIDGTTLSMTMFFPAGGSDQTPACSATLTGTAASVSTDKITVAYSGVDSCEPPANNGTLVMTRSP